MDWNAVFNWPGITLCISVISGAVCFIVKEIQHKRLARFDIAISKIYRELERFVQASNKIRININAMSLDLLLEHDAKGVDKWITYPIYDLENIALQIGMFFPEKDRKCIDRVVKVALEFKRSSLRAFDRSLPKVEQLDIYDKARVIFNKDYDSSMADVSRMIHDQLLGNWHV